MDFDVVILSAPGYMEHAKTNASIANVLLEDQLVADALSAQGLRVTRKSWDDPDFDWKSTHYAIFRSTWDYIHRMDEFSSWLKKVSQETKLINSASLIQWNFDKHYLQDLAQGGITIPNTVFVEQGFQTTLQYTINQALEHYNFQTSTIVLKPCVSGGARHTYRIEPSEVESHEKIFQDLIAKEAMMVQEFQANIVEKGEISMMVFNGEFTHAVLKVAKAGDFRVQDDFGGSVTDYVPSEAEILFAEKTVRMAPELPIYARVDIFRDNSNEIALAELEIFEPELWFRLNNAAATVLAHHIKVSYFGG